ncbi:MAG: class I SAM-dependent methyltransferase [Chlorobiota bacterium]
MTEVRFRDQMAAQYVALVAQRGAYWWYAVQRFLLHRMGLQRGGWLYDAGCGVGLYSLAIARQFPFVRIFAVDFSAESLRLLEAAARESGVEERIVCIQADITRWVPPHPVRWVLCTEVLQHIPTESLRLQALHRFAEGLLADGELWLLVARYTLRDRWRGIPKCSDERDRGGSFRMRFTPEELRRLLRQAGFSSVHLFGAPVPPSRVGNRLPPTLWKIAWGVQAVPWSYAWGRVMLAQARRQR